MDLQFFLLNGHKGRDEPLGVKKCWHSCGDIKVPWKQHFTVIMSHHSMKGRVPCCIFSGHCCLCNPFYMNITSQPWTSETLQCYSLLAQKGHRQSKNYYFRGVVPIEATFFVALFPPPFFAQKTIKIYLAMSTDTTAEWCVAVYKTIHKNGYLSDLKQPFQGEPLNRLKTCDTTVGNTLTIPNIRCRPSCTDLQK